MIGLRDALVKGWWREKVDCWVPRFRWSFCHIIQELSWSRILLSRTVNREKCLGIESNQSQFMWFSLYVYNPMQENQNVVSKCKSVCKYGLMDVSEVEMKLVIDSGLDFSKWMQCRAAVTSPAIGYLKGPMWRHSEIGEGDEVGRRRRCWRTPGTPVCLYIEFSTWQGITSPFSHLSGLPPLYFLDFDREKKTTTGFSHFVFWYEKE